MKAEKKYVNKARAAFARLQRKLRTINERATVEIPKVNITNKKPKILEKEERSFAGVKLKNGLNGENYVNGFRNPS